MNIYELITLFQINFDDKFEDIKKKYKKLIFKYHPDQSKKDTINQFIYIKKGFSYIEKMFMDIELDTTFREALLKYKNDKKIFINSENNLIRNIYLNNHDFKEFIISLSSLLYFLTKYKNKFRYYSSISEDYYKEKYNNFENKLNEISDYYIRSSLNKNTENEKINKSFEVNKNVFNLQKEIKILIQLSKDIFKFYINKMEKFNYTNPYLRRVFIEYGKIEEMFYELITEIFFIQIHFYKDNGINILDKNIIHERIYETSITLNKFEENVDNFLKNNLKHNNFNISNFDISYDIKKDKNFVKIFSTLKIMKNILINLKKIKAMGIPFPLAIKETKFWFETNL